MSRDQMAEPRSGRRAMAPLAALVTELRWAFRPPFAWLSGVVANAVIALVWLLVQPLRAAPRHDWAVVVGTYFVVWILADVTTTNVLGADADRLRRLPELRVGHILVLKNVTLLIITGIPTLLVTVLITVTTEPDDRVQITVPRVLFTMLTWFAVGNLISVLLPVAALPLKRRWQQRHELRRIAWWAGHLALPYALFYAVNPIDRVPRLLRGLAPHASQETWAGLLLIAAAFAVWAFGTGLSMLLARWLGVRWR